MKLKKLVWWLPLVALLIGCGGKPTAQELAEIDSLLWAEKNDSAHTTRLRSRKRPTAPITIC